MAELASSPAFALVPLRDTYGLRLTEKAIGVLSIRALNDDARTAIEAVLGAALPERVNATSTMTATLVVCTAPRVWRIYSEPGAHCEAVAMLSALDPTIALISDLSAGLCAIELRGNRAADVLATACPVDLHPLVFQTGDTVRTRFLDLAVSILKTADDSFLLICDRPHATIVRDWLVEAAHHPR